MLFDISRIFIKIFLDNFPIAYLLLFFVKRKRKMLVFNNYVLFHSFVPNFNLLFLEFEWTFSWLSFDNFDNQFIVLTYFYFGAEEVSARSEFSVRCFILWKGKLISLYGCCCEISKCRSFINEWLDTFISLRMPRLSNGNES